MTVSLIKQSPKDVTVAASSDTLSLTSSPGNTLVTIVWIAASSSVSNPVVTDTAGNTHTLLGTAWTSGQFDFAAVFACPNAAPVTGVTVGFGGGAKTFSYNILEVSGLDPATVVRNASFIARATSTSQASPTANASAGDFVIAGMNIGNTTATLATAGWTALTGGVAGNEHGYAAYRLPGTAESSTASWTLGVTKTAGAFTVAFAITSPHSAADGIQRATPLPVDLDSTFCGIGDLHMGNTSDDGTPTQDRAARITANLRHPLVPLPAAYVHPGDNTEDGTTAQLDIAKAFFAGLPAGPVQVVGHGNHDVDLNLKTATAWASYMGFSGPNRTIDVGDKFRFVLFGCDLDADVNDGITQIISSATLTWLDTALTACDASGRKAIIVTHAPLYNTVRATPTNSYDSASGQWHSVSVNVATTLSVAADTNSATTLTVASTAAFPASGFLLVTNSGGSGQQRTLQYTAKTGTTFTVIPNGASVTMATNSTVRLDDQSAALKTILGNHACTKAMLTGHTHSPKDAPGLATLVPLTGTAPHNLPCVNCSSPFYLSGGGLKRWNDPIITYWVTVLDDRTEVRAFDHGAGVWTDIAGAKVTTLTV